MIWCKCCILIYQKYQLVGTVILSEVMYNSSSVNYMADNSVLVLMALEAEFVLAVIIVVVLVVVAETAVHKHGPHI